MRSATSARICGGQRGQQGRGLRLVEVRKHQCDGLRVLVVNELGELAGVGLLDGVEGGGFRAESLGQAVQKTLGHVGSERRHQQFAGEFHTAARHVISRRGDMVKLVQNVFGLFSGNRSDLGHFAADLLDVFLGKLLQHFRARLFAKYDQ
jgi:hypothetical protein